MNSKNQDEITYSKVSIKKLVEHKSMFGIPDGKSDLQMMPLSEYRDMVKREAFFFIDHNGFLRHQLSGEVFAASKEHLDIIIEYLAGKRRLLDDAIDCAKE